MSNMVDNLNLNPELVKNVDPDLQPTKKRIMGPLSYAASFMGGCVSIGTFSMGAGLIGALTVGQAILAMVIGCLVIAVALVIIGNCGHKYGLHHLRQCSRPVKRYSCHYLVWFPELGGSGSHQQLSEHPVRFQQPSPGLCPVYNAAGCPGHQGI